MPVREVVPGWHSINWSKVWRNVRRLQARIVKATQQGRWNKARALQRLLTRSFSGKALAVRRVTENPGKHTPGVDQITGGLGDDRIPAPEVHRRLKAAFDPNGVLAPGRGWGGV